MFKILFFISLTGIIHTYILYPLLMLVSHSMAGARQKKGVSQNDLPEIEVLFAAYNEESVISDKILSTFKTSYPADKIKVHVGSDCSTDKTDALVRELQNKYPNLRLTRFDERTGKSGIINHLVEGSDAKLLILTDANIIFEPDTIPTLVSSMQNPRVGAVGGSIEYRKVYEKGISKQENTYLQLENRLKNAESDLFGAAMGLEGGCYIIRRELFPVIPPLTFMEDFYVSLSVLEKDYQVLLDTEARCFEDVSIASTEEYKRKVRISIGNFQNLGRFHKMIWNRFYPVGLVFLSHKVLRWFTPFFLVLLLLCSMALSVESRLFSLFAGIYFLFLSMGLFGILFSQSKSLSWIKYPGHFIYMNLALMRGFFIYLKGVKSNVWQPTTRNQN
ncbi:MAG: glycosyltransferase [Owenweeksia sp.]